MVSDGMSASTLSMTNLLKKRQFRSECHWIDLYHGLPFSSWIDGHGFGRFTVTDSATVGLDYFTRNTEVFDLMVNAAGINKNMALAGQ